MTMVHPNRHRGEISARLNGETRLLCLTLGALAELESAFGVANLVELAERFETGRLSARDIIRIVGAGLRGAGNRLDDEDVAAMSTDDGVAGFARIAAELLWATFGEAGMQAAGTGDGARDGAGPMDANREGVTRPPMPQAATR